VPQKVVGVVAFLKINTGTGTVTIRLLTPNQLPVG
jgi:hypothetical protein